ncbi:MAG: hypothetical protein ACE5ID_11670 [Acidobacteriota bacterium]
MTSERAARGIGLISGGLDSTLAAALLKEMGVELHGLHFSTGFCKTEHRRAIQDPRQDPTRLRNTALRAGAIVGFPVTLVDVAQAYLEVVKNPRYGYGANVNPCIDCRIFMLRKARLVMLEEKADFVFTGEVLGQRPMSQYKQALRLVEKQSGLEGRLLRPLSAHFLPATQVETQGLLHRAHLLAIQGRSRKAQIRLAAELGIHEYDQPSGGCCYLADASFARRFRDLVKHSPEGQIGTRETTLLKVGRHFRISGSVKMIAGRNEGENEFLERFCGGHWSFSPGDGAGALCLCIGEPADREKMLMAALAARYSKHRDEPEVAIMATRNGVRHELRVAPAGEETVLRYRL